MLIEITKEKFEIYENIRESGATNMFAVNNVIDLSGGELTREDCLEIMSDYDNLKNKYAKTTKTKNMKLITPPSCSSYDAYDGLFAAPCWAL